MQCTRGEVSEFEWRHCSMSSYHQWSSYNPRRKIRGKPGIIGGKGTVITQDSGCARFTTRMGGEQPRTLFCRNDDLRVKHSYIITNARASTYTGAVITSFPAASASSLTRVLYKSYYYRRYYCDYFWVWEVVLVGFWAHGTPYFIAIITSLKPRW